MSRLFELVMIGLLAAAFLLLALVALPKPTPSAATPVPIMMAMTQEQFRAMQDRAQAARNTFWRTGDVSPKILADMNYAPDLRFHFQPFNKDDVVSLDVLLPAAGGLRIPFPDIKGEYNETFIAGDKYVYWLKYTGTHTGPFPWGDNSIAPSGKKIEWTVMGICQLNAQGQTAECWELSDQINMLGQLGFTLAPPKP